MERKKETFVDKLLASRFFVIAALAHLLLLLFVGGTVIMERVIRPEPVFSPDNSIKGGDSRPPAPPQEMQMITEENPDITMPTETLNAPDVITVTSAVQKDTPMLAIAMPQPKLLDPSKKMKVKPKMDGFKKRATAVKNFTGDWVKNGDGMGGTGLLGVQGDDVVAKFVCYVAKYDVKDGGWYMDWDLRDGKVFKGAIPNLMRMCNLLSQGNLDCDVVGKPLLLSSSKIFKEKPPFIYFCGSKDFRLTSAEVRNLQKYLISGGAIWGDNRLAGKGSRFDIAFRREMRRVIPDVDKKFEPLPLNHAIYKKPKALYNLAGPPSGMNYYQEPVEVLKIDGEIAVIYTLNNYTDMMRMAFRPGDENPDTAWGPNKRFFIEGDFWDMRTIFFRNMEVKSSLEVFKFGVNVVVHLLTRFQEKLRALQE